MSGCELKQEKKNKKKFVSFEVNDEYDTPTYAFETLTCFRDCLREKIVWDPFVSETQASASRISDVFPEVKQVIHSREFDLLENKLPPQFDVIVTNPPFSVKKQVLENLLRVGSPFCVLLPLETLGRQYFARLMETHKTRVAVLLPQRKINFDSLKQGTKRKRSACPFHSVWVCYNMKPLQENHPCLRVYLCK